MHSRPVGAESERTMARSETLGIACPMANESAAAARFVTAVLNECRGARAVDFFAIVDKASTDDTLACLNSLSAIEPRLTVLWAPASPNTRATWLRTQFRFHRKRSRPSDARVSSGLPAPAV